MTDRTPQHPPIPTSTAFKVAPVMYGEKWADFDGVPVFADHDGVRITTLGPDGNPVVSVLQTAEAAMGLAQLLMKAAGTTIHQSVGDDGKPLPAHVRLARYNAAYRKANS